MLKFYICWNRLKDKRRFDMHNMFIINSFDGGNFMVVNNNIITAYKHFRVLILYR